MNLTPDFPRGVAVCLREREQGMHRALITDKLTTALPGVELFFASSSEELTNSERIEALITPVSPWIDDIVLLTPNLKWIHFLSAGVDGIWDLNFDKEKYILTKSSGVHAIPMSEYAIGGMLYFLKGFGIFHHQQRQRLWKRHWLDESTGKTVAILGLGAIGMEIARRCKDMGMRVLGMATSVRSLPNVDRVVDPSGIDEILPETDFIVVCLPLTPHTKNFLNAETLHKTKKGVYLIDISRGTIVDQDVLVKLLQNGHVAGAVLDVFEEEPLPSDSPLWDLENVLITPHVSGTTPRYMERAIDIFLQNRASFLDSSKLTTAVDVRMKY